MACCCFDVGLWLFVFACVVAYFEYFVCCWHVVFVLCGLVFVWLFMWFICFLWLLILLSRLVFYFGLFGLLMFLCFVTWDLWILILVFGVGYRVVFGYFGGLCVLFAA